MGTLPDLKVDQIGIVVRDLEQAVQRYTGVFAVGPWQVWTYSPLVMVSSSYRGQPGSFSMRLALAGASPQVELIEPLGGPSLYHEWLDDHGEGLHHIGSRVASVRAGAAEVVAAGYACMQSGYGYGLDGDGGFAYFDTVADFGVILELIEVPTRRIEPEVVLSDPA